MMWELLTCEHPFKEFTRFGELENAIIKGTRPKLPATGHPVYNALMLACWDADPELRPTYAQVLEQFPQLVKALAPGLERVFAAEKRPSPSPSPRSSLTPLSGWSSAPLSLQ